MARCAEEQISEVPEDNNSFPSFSFALLASVTDKDFIKLRIILIIFLFLCLICYFVFFFFFSVHSIQAKRLYHFAFYFPSFFNGDILNETHNSISNAWAFARAVHLQFSTLIFHTFCLSLSASKSSNWASPSLSILSMTGMSKKNKLPEAITNTLWRKFLLWAPFCTNYVYKHQVFFSGCFHLASYSRRVEKKAFHRYHHVYMRMNAPQSYNRRRVVCRDKTLEFMHRHLINIKGSFMTYWRCYKIIFI